MELDEVDIVVRREYRDANGAPVELIIGKPEPDPRPGGDWRCPIAVISEDGPSKVWEIFGLDPFQALILGIGIARTLLTQLEQTHGPFNWAGGVGLGLDYRVFFGGDDPSES